MYFRFFVSETTLQNFAWYNYDYETITIFCQVFLGVIDVDVCDKFLV